MVSNEPTVVDVTEYFQSRYDNALKAEQRGADVLILYRLAEPVDVCDAEDATLQLEYRWLPYPTAELCRVQGNEFSYWREDEIDLGQSLFSQLRLFP